MKRLLPWLAALFLGTLAAGKNAPEPAPLPQLESRPATSFDQTIEELRERYERALAKPSPRETIETLSWMAALSVLHVLDVEGRYESPTTGGPSSASIDARERWFYSGDKVARVEVDEFPAYFELLEYQSKIGMMVGVPDDELDRRLAGHKVPHELIAKVEELVERARTVDVL